MTAGFESPDCECRVSGDQADASDCPLHGPGSDSARTFRVQEAAEEAAWWAQVPEETFL